MNKRELIIGISIIVIVFGLAVLLKLYIYSSESYKQAKASTEVSLENPQISERRTGEYNKSEFGSSYKMYSLKGTEQVMYETLNGYFLLVDKSESDIGTADYIVPLDTDSWREPNLIGVTPNYLIFSVKKYTGPGKEQEKIAIEIAETLGNVGDRTFHKCIKYNELDFAEKCKMCEVVSVEEIKN